MRSTLTYAPVEKNGKINNTAKEQNLINTMLLPPGTALAPENLANLEYGFVLFLIYINILIYIFEFLHMRFLLCDIYLYHPFQDHFIVNKTIQEFYNHHSV